MGLMMTDQGYCGVNLRGLPVMSGSHFEAVDGHVWHGKGLCALV